MNKICECNFINHQAIPYETQRYIGYVKAMISVKQFSKEYREFKLLVAFILWSDIRDMKRFTNDLLMRIKLK